MFVFVLGINYTNYMNDYFVYLIKINKKILKSSED